MYYRDAAAVDRRDEQSYDKLSNFGIFRALTLAPPMVVASLNLSEDQKRVDPEWAALVRKLLGE